MAQSRRRTRRAATQQDVNDEAEAAMAAAKASAVPAVAEAEPQLPAAPVEPPPRGLEEIDASDLVIPRFAIVQPTSEEGTPGKLRDAISGEEYEELHGVVLLKVRKGRVNFDDDGVLCASDDRITPATRISEPIQPECAGCPEAEWRTEKGKRIHPNCQETYTLLIAHDGMPYFITFKSGAIKDCKKLLTQLSLRCRKERLDSFGYYFSVGTEEVKFDLGKAFMPRFTGLTKCSSEDYELYGALFESFAQQAPTFDDKPPADSETDDSFAFGENAR